MLWVFIIYAAVIILICLWGGIVGLRFKGTLKPAPLPPVPPKVSTVVPARNEERNIDRCARGLVGQTYPDLEMIFVDDASTDATPDILARVAARDARVKIVHTGGKPSDWNGKQWACYSGAQAAAGDWLCFMDADTFAEPHLLARTVAFAEAHRIDMLTLQPWYELGGLWERIVLPAGLTPLFLVYPPHRVNDPRDSLVIANGQFILIRREVYQAIGGHEAVRHRMMDDFSLAELVKRSGHRLFIAEGMDVMRVRLYTNLREIWSGALKAAVEISGGWLTSTIALIANLLVNILPFALLIWAIVAGNRPTALVLSVIVAFQLLYYALVRMAAFRAPPWTAITYPFGGLLITAILLDGMIRLALGHDIRWKDRPLIGVPRPNIRARLSDRWKR
jgi:chlorobactene glucosyltransferase